MARPKKPQNQTRLNLVMRAEVKDLLEQLKEDTHAYSLGEVVTRALRYYHRLNHLTRVEGARIVVERPDGRLSEFEII